VATIILPFICFMSRKLGISTELITIPTPAFSKSADDLQVVPGGPEIVVSSRFFISRSLTLGSTPLLKKQKELPHSSQQDELTFVSVNSIKS